MLYIVPTPIGNLEDMTYRAVRVLKEADLILAEDTRNSKKLLDHYGIEQPMRPHHAHNEHATTPGLVEQLEQGATMALISDAGTPGISDPGFYLVRQCRRNEIPVVVLPGPTSFVPALVASGLPSDRFFFEGFLPHKKGRKTRLEWLCDLPYTFILFESPYRLVKCLKQLVEHCGPERRACVARELTKIHEEVRTNTLEALVTHYDAQAKVKGEIVVIVEGKG